LQYILDFHASGYEDGQIINLLDINIPMKLEWASSEKINI